MTTNVFISGLGSFYPNDPISNDQIDNYIGTVDVAELRAKSQLLKINGINKRYYALDRSSTPTHLSEEMGYLAGKSALDNAKVCIEDVDLLSFGTSFSDLIIPSLSHQVHGQFGTMLSAKPMRIMPTTGVCLSGIFSFDIAFNYLKYQKEKYRNAVVGGVERPSVSFLKNHYIEECTHRQENKALYDNYKFMHGAFLRWMLSDGAGAAVLTNQPVPGRKCLKVDWVEIRSYANELPVCMYAGTNDPTSLTPRNTYYAQNSMSSAERQGMTVLRQDPTILGEYIVEYAVREMKRLKDEGVLCPTEIDHFLPHISSYGFFRPLADSMEKEGISIPTTKWFLNLETKGNTGSAYIYNALNECFSEGKINVGDKILMMIPESARFGYGFIQLSCVVT